MSYYLYSWKSIQGVLEAFGDASFIDITVLENPAFIIFRKAHLFENDAFFYMYNDLWNLALRGFLHWFLTNFYYPKIHVLSFRGFQGILFLYYYMCGIHGITDM